MAGKAEIKVIAPIPVLDYSNPSGKLLRLGTITPRRQDGSLEVFHPYWLYPPGGTPLNVLCLAARIAPLLWKIRRKYKFEIVDAHFGYPEGVTAALLAWLFQVPFVVTLRGSETAFASSRFRNWLMGWAFRRAAAIVAVSEELRNFAIAKGVSPKKALFIPNGIDVERFFPRNREEMRAKYGIGSGHKLIVSAGELIEAKGHQHVAQAVRDLLVEGVDVELMIVGNTSRGGPKYESSLKRIVATLGVNDHVRFAGWADRSSLAELLCAADVFCLASYSEGWPNVIHEALASGVPVVATGVGAVPTMIPSPRYGLIVPPRDQSALLDALRSALETQWNTDEIARWGRARSWGIVADEVTGALLRIIGNNRDWADGAPADSSRLGSSKEHVRN
jgi:glycosyltransferase involved in cell wall biosynthesis